MTEIRTTVRVGNDGNVIVPVGADEAGTEVEVTITPARPKLTQEEYVAILKRAAGSIDDPTFERPPQWDLQEREPLE
jgi:hypothetical protein